MVQVAVYDACVLDPAPLRDFLLQLALTDLFQAYWSASIRNEWIRVIAGIGLNALPNPTGPRR